MSHGHEAHAGHDHAPKPKAEKRHGGGEGGFAAGDFLKTLTVGAGTYYTKKGIEWAKKIPGVKTVAEGVFSAVKKVVAFFKPLFR